MQQLQLLAPEAFSEGQLDVAALKRALGEEPEIEGGERYALTWAGKANAYKILQTPSAATLRPQRELSVNFDTAQHIFIEGENLEVLKVRLLKLRSAAQTPFVAPMLETMVRLPLASLALGTATALAKSAGTIVPANEFRGHDGNRSPSVIQEPPTCPPHWRHPWTTPRRLPS